MPLLEVENLAVRYGHAEALHEVNLTVEEGEIVAIVGANGAGKTTLLRSISGLLHPHRGQIRFRGAPLHRMNPREIVNQGIVQVPEGRRLFPLMTVLENLQLGGYNSRARNRRPERLRYVFRLFPRLEERQQQRAGTLSGGEQQMVTIGRALMADPTVLLLDEPSLGLAPHLVSEIFAAIRQINESGITVVLVEQNVDRALAMSVRGYVLENGRTTLSGTSNELLGNEKVRRAYLGL